MDARRFLKRAILIDHRIEARAEELKRLETRMRGGTVRMEETVSRGSKQRGLEDPVAEAEAMRDEIARDIEDMCRVKREINEVIDSVESEKHRTVLEMRYRNGWTVERIAKELHYSYQHVVRLHREALKIVEKKKNFSGAMR